MLNKKKQIINQESSLDTPYSTLSDYLILNKMVAIEREISE